MMRDDKEAVTIQSEVNVLLPSNIRGHGVSLLKASTDPSAEPKEAHKGREHAKLTPEEVVPEAIRSMTEYKRKFSFLEMYRSFVHAQSDHVHGR